jgi:enoyl-CoA hydratase/carnithine racemase
MLQLETIRYVRNGYVGTLTLARPAKHNAQNPLMWQELRAIGKNLATDDELRCLVIDAEGPSFSAGIDLVEGMANLLGEWSGRALDDELVELGLEAAGTFAWIPRLRCPSIAAIQGHAIGAGLQLALACDFRLLAESARVGLAETRFGLIPDMGANSRLPRIVGEARARELILLAKVIDASEAERIGLANRVVPDDQLAAAARELAEEIASRPPMAMTCARRALEAAWSTDQETSLRRDVEEQARCVASVDFRAAAGALANGRREATRSQEQ